MKISIIIPTRKIENTDKIINSIRNTVYPMEDIEVLISIGGQPSIQRNKAVREASGDLAYFFDNDSEITPEIFNMAAKHFIDDKIAAVGGPNLTPPKDTFLQHCFGWALASRFANGNVASRYLKTGKIRESGEKELILCNLCVRRDVYNNIGGLNETIYPNEENEFMNRLKKHGYKLMYDPDVFIYRSRRKNFSEVIKQHLNYGRGRMEQTLIEGIHPETIQFLIPLFFLFYILLLPFFANFIYYIPLYAYLLLACISGLLWSFETKNIKVFFVMPIIYLVMHISYGCGNIWGFYRKKIKQMKNIEHEIEIVKLKKFGEKNF